MDKPRNNVSISGIRTPDQPWQGAMLANLVAKSNIPSFRKMLGQIDKSQPSCLEYLLVCARDSPVQSTPKPCQISTSGTPYLVGMRSLPCITSGCPAAVRSKAVKGLMGVLSPIIRYAQTITVVTQSVAVSALFHRRHPAFPNSSGGTLDPVGNQTPQSALVASAAASS